MANEVYLRRLLTGQGPLSVNDVRGNNMMPSNIPDSCLRHAFSEGHRGHDANIYGIASKRQSHDSRPSVRSWKLKVAHD